MKSSFFVLYIADDRVHVIVNDLEPGTFHGRAAVGERLLASVQENRGQKTAFSVFRVEGVAQKLFFEAKDRVLCL
jgi:hypothetical protein